MTTADRGVLPTLSSPFATDLLRDRVAVVSGGGTGIGLATARRLAACGATLVLCGRREEILERAAGELERETDTSVVWRGVDIRRRDDVTALAGWVDAEFGQADILVNNAGGQFPHRARELSEKGWRAVIDTNLTGTWNMTQAFGDQMLAGRGGSICQVVIVVGRGVPGLVHSAAARAGVVEMTRTLAYEWGPRVRCNAVAPGPIRTDGFDDAYDPDHVRHVAGLPLMAHGTTDDVANAIAFLVSPAASYITGEVVNVAGGQPLQGPVQVLARSSFPERALSPSAGHRSAEAPGR